MRRFVVLACVAMGVALACLVGTQAAAPAIGNSRPPAAVLMKGEKVLQAGRLGSFCWYEPPNFPLCADAFPNSYPHAKRVEADSTLHIRIRKAEEPRRAYLSTAHRLDPDGWPVDSRRLAISLKPVRREGRTVAWDAFFSVKRPDTHYYLFFSGWWDEGDASWDFHVKTPGRWDSWPSWKN
jgi:hypothetical protein